MNKILKENNEPLNIENLLDIYSKSGIKSAELYMKKSNDIHDNKNINPELSNDEIIMRSKEFLKYTITNDTIYYINDLYHEYVQDNESTNDKGETLKILNDKIYDAIERIKYNEKLDNNENNILKIKDINLFQFSLWILGQNIELDWDKGIDYYYEKMSEEYKKIKNGGAINDDLFISAENDGMTNKNENLLKYLTDKEWNNLISTLSTIPLFDNDKNNEKDNKEKNKLTKERLMDVINFVKIYTFYTQIPGKILNFRKSIYDKIEGITYRGFPRVQFFNFGERAKSSFFIQKFFGNELKDYYIDLISNSGLLNNNQKDNIFLDKSVMVDIYKNINSSEFWNNVSIISCWTHESFNLVLSAISELNVRNDLEIRKKPITKSLKTSTIIISIRANDENEQGSKNKLRNKGEELPVKNMTEKSIMEKYGRIYFIVVTEGIIQKGQMFNKISNGIKNMFNMKNGNKLFGIDISNNTYK